MLSGPYLRATDKFLRDNGVDPDAVEQVMQLLAGFAEPEAEDATVGTRGTFNGYGQDAKQMFRQMAQDRALPLHLRRWPAPAMTARQQASYEQRFPGATRIRPV